MKRTILTCWTTSLMAGGLLLFNADVRAAPNRGLDVNADAKAHAKDAATEVTHAVAVISPTKGNEVRGTVKFEQMADGVRVTATLKGLSPGKHAIHVHEFGDLSAPDATSAGGHFNPGDHAHAGPDTKKRHAGDMGNLTADDDGNATWSFTAKNFSLAGKHSVLGRAVIIHAGADDLESQPSGDAGGRVGGGVIGRANKES